MASFGLNSVSMLAVCSLALLISACGGGSDSSSESSSASAPAQQSAEETSENAENMTTAMETAASDAADSVEEAADDAADKVANAAEEAASNTQAAVEEAVADASDQVEAMTASAQGALASLNGDATKGRRVFAKCMACHTVQEGQNRVGPSLYKIIGREAGTVEGFNYSDANANSGIVWTEEILFEYLENPQEYMPGTRMIFPGLPAEQDRADVIAYLKSASE